jgi:hypothetical protein
MTSACCDALIGGGPPLRKPARLLTVERRRTAELIPGIRGLCAFACGQESVVLSQAEPGSDFRRQEFNMAKHKSAFERLSGDRLNRKQRRLSIVNPNAGGIDVGNESHFVAVPSDRDPSPVQEFGCWTADLIRMAKWLQSGRIDTVAIQATGVYWIAARHSDRPWHPRGWGERAEYEKRAGPENGCPAVSVAWPPARRHGQLHTYGLLRDSFHLAKEMEGVRTIWRLRARHVEEAGQAIQHMQKGADQNEHPVGKCSQRHQRSER